MGMTYALDRATTFGLAIAPPTIHIAGDSGAQNMRMKAGLVIGFTAGYVLGARAGRERYEEIRRWWTRLRGSPAVHRATERASGVRFGQPARR